MTIRLQTFKVWVTPTIGVCLFLFASTRAWTARASAAQKIDALNQLCSSLNQAADQAQAQRPDPSETVKVMSLHEDLQRRLAESSKPGMIQAELMASARNVGLNVRDLQPVPVTTDRKDSPVYPCYRVAVRGAYAQLCDYMQTCKQQRVPARPINFRVMSVRDDAGKPSAELQAEITLESFMPQVKKPSAEGVAP